MNWRTILLFLILLAPDRLLAEPLSMFPGGQSGGNPLCRQAIAAAERAHGIPTRLLAAIARVESGRRDPASGTFDPWPWTINMDGAGSFYDTKPQAVTAAVAMRRQATRSIDVGCMQISLTYHPDAFASIEQAFDPWANADYGARFLVELYQKTNSWPRAVELYHSATLDIGQEYGRRVYAALPEETKLADATQPAPLAGGWAMPVNRSLLTSALRPSPPHVIPLASGIGGGGVGTGASGGVGGGVGGGPGRSLDSYRSLPVRFASRGM